MHESKASEIMQMVNSYIQAIYAGAGARGLTGNGKHTIDSEGRSIAPCPAFWNKIMKDHESWIGKVVQELCNLSIS